MRKRNLNSEKKRPEAHTWEAVNEAGEVVATAPREKILRQTFADDFEIRRRA